MVIHIALARSITTPGCQAIFHAALLDLGELLALDWQYGTKLLPLCPLNYMHRPRLRLSN
jgi:hypothetical protein